MQRQQGILQIHLPDYGFLEADELFSVFRVKVVKKKCISCGKYERVGLMNVEVPNNSRKKQNETECIFVHEMRRKMPENAVRHFFFLLELGGILTAFVAFLIYSGNLMVNYR